MSNRLSKLLDSLGFFTADTLAEWKDIQTLTGTV